MHIRYFFQQNSPRLTNSCENYKTMTNIFYTATDDMPKVLNIEVPFRAQKLFLLTLLKHRQDYKTVTGIPVTAQRVREGVPNLWYAYHWWYAEAFLVVREMFFQK